jgi:hypothetical protein
LERYHIYRTNRENLHMNDTHLDTQYYIWGTTRDGQKITVNAPPPTTITRYQNDGQYTSDSLNIPTTSREKKHVRWTTLQEQQVRKKHYNITRK